MLCAFTVEFNSIKGSQALLLDNIVNGRGADDTKSGANVRVVRGSNRSSSVILGDQ